MEAHITPCAIARDAIADTFDVVFTNSATGHAQRILVWRELELCFRSGNRVLEIDCATGVDAAHLADFGIEVWACEESPKMLEQARRRIASSELGTLVNLRLLAARDILHLESAGPFDGAFSNFGALNCVKDLASVGRNLARLLKPGAKLVLCMAGKCVAWEILLFLWQGRFQQAFRRLGPGPVHVRLVDDIWVACWYPSIRKLRRAFGPHFRLCGWRGVGVALPPTYFEKHANRFPRIMNFAASIDPWLGRIPLMRNLADHLLLTFERVAR